MTAMTPKAHRARLRRNAAAIEKADATAERLRSERDQFVIEAARDGCSKVEIAEWAKVVRSYVYTILGPVRSKRDA